MDNQARDNIRSAIFNQVTRNKEVQFAGITMELRQPSVGAILGREKTDHKAFMTQMLIDYCYVPGTDEKVFEEADQESLMAVPFNADWVNLQKAIDELSDLGTQKAEEVKN